MLRVGLTGGIGSGKSTVAGRLAEHGAVLVDADVIAREVVAPGTDGLAEVVAAFGDRVLAIDGSLDRSALAAIVFADADARTALNGIVHPRVGARTMELMAGAADDAVVVHDVPLLVENDLAPDYHLVVVVDAPAETRVHRLVLARGMSEQDARARIAAQADDEQRREVADVWLSNAGSPDEVLADVDALWADRLVRFEANVRLHRIAEAADRTVPADPTWPAQAARLAARIRRAAGERVDSVRHVGPTSVVDTPAVDVLHLSVMLRAAVDAQPVAQALLAAGFPGRDGHHGNADPGRPATVEVGR